MVVEMTAEQQFGEDWCVDQTHGGGQRRVGNKDEREGGLDKHG